MNQAQVGFGRDATGLPLLSAGRHLVSEDGACFMEFASLLAGEPFSDHPRCTHPAVTQLAQLVNDASPAATRASLLSLVPAVIGLTGRDGRVTPTLVHSCVDIARRAGPRPVGPRLEGAARRAVRRLNRLSNRDPTSAWVTVTDSLYRRGPAYHAMRRSVSHIRKESPAGQAVELVHLLREAIAQAKQLLAPGRTQTSDTRQRQLAACPQGADQSRPPVTALTQAVWTGSAQLANRRAGRGELQGK